MSGKSVLNPIMHRIFEYFLNPTWTEGDLVGTKTQNFK